MKPFPALELITGLPKTVSLRETQEARREYFCAVELLEAVEKIDFGFAGDRVSRVKRIAAAVRKCRKRQDTDEIEVWNESTDGPQPDWWSR